VGNNVGLVMTRERRAVFLAGSAVLTLSLIRTAWLCDDAYISFRTADNILNGYGPVWNVGERVQAFTHPLWLALCTVAFAITSNVYFTAIALGIMLTFASVWLLATRVATTTENLLVCYIALLSSKAWIDYSTSGLENPLTHLLILCFVILQSPSAVSTSGRVGGNLQSLSFIAALLMLNRLDLLLLVGPALAYQAWRAGPRAAIRPALIGFLPVIAWLLFATFYYGTPFPNTAYAKLNNVMTPAVRWERGIDYLLRTLRADPVTLPVIALSIFAITRRRLAADGMLFAGAVLYVVYVTSIGGDFMMGRFLTAPFVIGIALLARAEWLQRPARARAAAVAVLILGLLAPWEPAVLSGYGYAYAHRQILGPEPWGDGDPPTIRLRGITDERHAYYEATGLLKVGRRGLPTHLWVTQGLELRARGDRVVVLENIGFRGFYAGPNVHIIDALALADPLLARLPGGGPDSIVGHFKRALPDGYVASVAEGRNALVDPDLGAYYERLHFVVTGPLWSRERLITALKLLAGAYDERLRSYISRE
jgi:arabinofuranosyltransferase